MSLGASVITLRRLHEVSMNKIDAGGLSFWAVVNKTESDSSGLRLLERQRVKMWLKRAFAEISQAGVCAFSAQTRELIGFKSPGPLP